MRTSTTLLTTLLPLLASANVLVPRNMTTTIPTTTLTCDPGVPTIGICIDNISCGVMWGGCFDFCSNSPVPQPTTPAYVHKACSTWTETTTTTPVVIGTGTGVPTTTTNGTWTQPTVSSTTVPTETGKPTPPGPGGEEPPQNNMGARMEAGVMVVVPAVLAGVMAYLM